MRREGEDEDSPYVSVKGILTKRLIAEDLVYEVFSLTSDQPFERESVNLFRFTGIVPGLGIEEHNFAYWDNVREIIGKYFEENATSEEKE